MELRQGGGALLALSSMAAAAVLFVLHLSFCCFFVDGFRVVSPGDRHPARVLLRPTFQQQPISSYDRASVLSPPRPALSSPLSRLLLAIHRTPFVGGNWKSYGTRDQINELVKRISDRITERDVEVIVCPPSPYLSHLRDHIVPPTNVAAQNVAVHEGYGAYTGEYSGRMLKDLGVNWTLVGHSERRKGFQMAGESDALVANKTKAALKQGLNVVLCVGEDLAERESHQTNAVLDRQLKEVAQSIDESNWNNVVIAYEPVWAIGTGKAATSDIAQQTHHAIREWMKKNVSPQVADSVRIIYGGSVTIANADELGGCPDVDGFLVGGASLKEDFIAIVRSAAIKTKKANTPCSTSN